MSEYVKNNSSYFIKKFEENNYSQSIVEAIINSIQAKASYVYIHTYIDKKQILFSTQNNKETQQETIKGFRIEDNGEGFTKENEDAFLEWNCDHKADIGCEGVGRANYLKTFDKTTIISFVDNKKKSLNFTDKLNDDDKFEIEEIKGEDIKEYKLEKDKSGNF